MKILSDQLKVWFMENQPSTTLYLTAASISFFSVLVLYHLIKAENVYHNTSDLVNISIPHLIVLLTLLIWKFLELSWDILHLQSRIVPYMPHRFGYLITYMTAILALGYFYHVLTTNENFWYAHIAMQMAQLYALSAYCVISTMTNPLPYSIVKMYALQIALFGCSNMLLTLSMISSHTNSLSSRWFYSSDQLASMSMLCSFGNFLIQGSFFIMKFKLFLSQFISIDQAWIYRWECIAFASFNLLYHLLRMMAIRQYLQSHKLENCLLARYKLFGLYLLVMLCLPHRQLASYFNFKVDELNKRDKFVRVHLHDTRSPIATIVQGLELTESLLASIKNSSPSLLMRSQVESAEELVQDMNVSCSLAMQQLNEFLFYDKLQANTRLSELEMSFISLKKFIDSCIRPFNIQAKALKINLIVNLDAMKVSIEDLSIYVDSNKVVHVLHNLLSNAFKFSPMHSTISLKVILIPGFTMQPRWNKYLDIRSIGVIRIEVIDEGVGISIANQRKLFRQYSQINPNKLQAGGGSGLGLWSSKEVIEEHGGVIGLQCLGEGHGACFYFELAVYDKTEAEVSTPLAAQPAMPLAVAQPIVPSSVLGKSYRLLIVDDSVLTVKMVKRILRDAYLVDEVAYDGSAALDCIRFHQSTDMGHYDLILLDYNMPEMNGPETCQQIRNLGYHGIIIGVTASMSPEDREEFIDAGANEVIVKPVTCEAILRVVNMNQLILANNAVQHPNINGSNNASYPQVF
jgi:signal transduction histidine kinase/CheY-like chemotaxis protein